MRGVTRKGEEAAPTKEERRAVLPKRREVAIVVNWRSGLAVEVSQSLELGVRVRLGDVNKEARVRAKRKVAARYSGRF